MKLFIIFYLIMALLSIICYYLAIWFGMRSMGLENTKGVLKHDKPIKGIFALILSSIFWPIYLLFNTMYSTVIIYMRYVQTYAINEFYQEKGKHALEVFFRDIMHI